MSDKICYVNMKYFSRFMKSLPPDFKIILAAAS
jgi:hypothetical protein